MILQVKPLNDNSMTRNRVLAIKRGRALKQVQLTITVEALVQIQAPGQLMA